MGKSIFEAPEGTVDVKVSYAETKKGPIVFYSDEEKKAYSGDGEVKTAVAKFSYERWANFNMTMRSCVEKQVDPVTGESAPFLDAIAFRDKRLRALMKSIKDGDGKTVEVNNDFFDNMLPDFGTVLLSQYNLVMSNLRPDKDELENVVESSGAKDAPAKIE